MQADEQPHAFLPHAQRAPTGLPGVRAAALIAILSALLGGYWGWREVEAADRVAATGVSRMAEVDPDEIGAALETVAVSPKQMEQFRAREACSRKLAWVTVARVPGQPPGRIRLQSGRYLSPAFDLTDMPVRVAIPYPAPYATGRGNISVLGTTTDAVVALTPPWHVSAQQGSLARDVTWTPVGACPAANR